MRNNNKEAFAFCLLALTLTGKFIYPVAKTPLRWLLEPISLGLQCRLKTSNSRDSLELRQQTGTTETSSVVHGMAIRSLVFTLGDRYCWTTQTTACKPL